MAITAYLTQERDWGTPDKNLPPNQNIYRNLKYIKIKWIKVTNISCLQMYIN